MHHIFLIHSISIVILDIVNSADINRETQVSWQTDRVLQVYAQE